MQIILQVAILTIRAIENCESKDCLWSLSISICYWQTDGLSIRFCYYTYILTCSAKVTTFLKAKKLKFLSTHLFYLIRQQLDSFPPAIGQINAIIIVLLPATLRNVFSWYYFRTFLLVRIFTNLKTRDIKRPLIKAECTFGLHLLWTCLLFRS